MYYSNIAEAWNHDPVKEMTDKLSNGIFQTNNSRAEIYNFKNNQKNNQYNQKNQKNNQKNNQRNNTSDITSLSILSDDTDIDSIDSIDSIGTIDSLGTIDSDISYASINSKKNAFGYPYKKKHRSNKYQYISDSDTKYNDSLDHQYECNQCHKNLIKLVNSKVDKKFKELMLENKLNQLEHFTTNAKQSSTNLNIYWKDTLIIVAGIVIALIIILLIVKSFNK